MTKTSLAFASCCCVVPVVVLCGCAQALGIDGWTHKGEGGQGGAQGSSSATAGQGGAMGSSSAAIGSSSAGSGGQNAVASSSAGSGGQGAVGSTGSGTCTLEGMPCQDPAECCGQTCNGGVCVGCLASGTACAGGGCCGDLICGSLWQCCRYQGNCTSNGDCCSQSCLGGTCGILCTDETLPCSADAECCPGLVCKGGKCAISCAAEGHTCSLNSDCCVNLECKVGLCSASCTPQWKPCSANTECCPGYTCPAGLCTASNDGQYESESNNGITKANIVFPGKVCGSISPSGDNDWFGIVLPGGVKLSATVVPGAGGACAPTGTIDSELEIRTPVTVLGSNDDISSANYCSSTAASTSVPGTYYVHVRASQVKAPAATFSYCVTLTVSN